MRDTEWAPDFAGERYESRRLHGCFLSAGTNAPSKSFEARPPWICSLDGLTDAEAASVADLLTSTAEVRTVRVEPHPSVAALSRAVTVRGWGHTQPDAKGKAETCAQVMSTRVRLMRGAK